jgi:diphosphomevalonate decarboxylase
LLPAGSKSAEAFLPPDHWPELRFVFAIVTGEKKRLGSREAMELARTTSPYYDRWVALSQELCRSACNAVRSRAIDDLGALMRQSYLAMFATMHTSDPPTEYWLPESVGLQRVCESLRRDSIPAWETMDAGPQVKILTTAEHVDLILERIRREIATVDLLVTTVGGEPRVHIESDTV